MTNPEDKFNINLNQNLWVLIVVLLTIGISEYYGLCILFWFGITLGIVSSISIIACLIFYTYYYCMKKIKMVKDLEKNEKNEPKRDI